MQCGACEAINRATRRYCHACGVALATAPCPQCGFENYAFEQWCGGCGAHRSDTGTLPERRAPPPASTAPSAEAERRQMTVMFCDLVGSTRLSGELDAEDLRALITRFQGACAAEIARFDGFIARYMGDGMLVYFGYPRAHEDSAERAVRAGLAIVEAVGRIADQPVPVHVRVGIATGRVVVGDLIGEGASEERAVVGETPNLAARLQALAEPDAVVISHRTRRLVGAAVACEDLGRHPLKGFDEPVQAWRALRVTAGVQRGDGTAERAAHVLVGRDFELALLADRWTQVGPGSGRVVVLAGAAGSGKSRLIDALVDRIAPDGDTDRLVVRYRCLRHHDATVLFPVIDLISRAAGLDLTDPTEERRAKVEAWVRAWSGDAPRDTAAMLALLSLDDAPTASPQAFRTEVLASLWRSYEARKLTGPLLVVFEDVQWADPTTIEMIEGMLDRADAARLMIALTHRDDFVPPWRRRGNTTTLDIGRLPPDAAAALVRQVAGTRLPADVEARILERSDGVPAFLVELTRAVQARRGGEHAGSLGAIEVPETLQDSLTAQLDRLGPGREVAQTAATIGREFSTALLRRALDGDPARLQAGLDELLGAGLIVPAGPALYAFRHALLADVAADSLLKRVRASLHDRIANVLLTELPEAAHADPAAVARHLTGAGRGREAADWWRKAGERAATQGAMRESASHYRCALAALTPVADPSAPPDADALAALHTELALKLRLMGEYAEALVALDRAEAAATPHDLFERLSHVYHTRGNIHFHLGEAKRCAEAHDRALALARQAGSALAEVRALGGLADARVAVGDLDGARTLGIRCADVAMAHGFYEIAAANAPVVAFTGYWDADQARAYADLAWADPIVERAGAPRSRIMSWLIRAMLAAAEGDTTAASEWLARVHAEPGWDQMFHPQMIAVVECEVAELDDDGPRLARALAEFGRSGPSPVGRALMSVALADAPPERFARDLEEVLEALPGETFHARLWTATALVRALFKRQDWAALARALAILESSGVRAARRIAAWLDVASAALARATDPSRDRTALDALAASDVVRSDALLIHAIDRLLRADAHAAVRRR